MNVKIVYVKQSLCDKSPYSIVGVITHYDLLADENNDPVHDTKPLRVYINKAVY